MACIALGFRFYSENKSLEYYLEILTYTCGGATALMVARATNVSVNSAYVSARYGNPSPETHNPNQKWRIGFWTSMLIAGLLSTFISYSIWNSTQPEHATARSQSAFSETYSFDAHGDD